MIRNNKRQSLQHSVVALLLHGKEMRYGNFREMTDFNVRRSGGLLARPRIKKYVEFYIASYTLFLFIYPWAVPTPPTALVLKKLVPLQLHALLTTWYYSTVVLREGDIFTKTVTRERTKGTSHYMCMAT